jgi:hypothetical protein
MRIPRWSTSQSARRRQLLRRASAHAAVRRHRPLAALGDEGDDAGRAFCDRSDELDAERCELPPPSRGVGAALAQRASAPSEAAHAARPPGRQRCGSAPVRRRRTRACSSRTTSRAARPRVRSAGASTAIGHNRPMDGDDRSGVPSFLIGASSAPGRGRHSRAAEPPGAAAHAQPAGLAAFEGAPATRTDRGGRAHR